MPKAAYPVQVDHARRKSSKSGKATVAEYLQTLTSDGQGSVPYGFRQRVRRGATAGISLRGLGANATLVLVNGRRLAPSAALADDAQRTVHRPESRFRSRRSSGSKS